MNKPRLLSVIASSALILSVLPVPIVYYYLGGLIGNLTLKSLDVIGLALTFILIILYLRTNKEKRTRFQLLSCYLIPILGVGSLFSGRIIEKADWWLRRNSREEIIQRVIHGEIGPDADSNGTSITLDGYNIPPISTNGNQIMIYRDSSKAVTVEFYINRGFLDHYSAFVFTNNPNKISKLEKRVNLQLGSGNNERLSANWYRVSY
jgi:hypothetical protein